jgi:hypothetical protein
MNIDEQIDIYQWAIEHKAKVDRFVVGYIADKIREGEESAIPDTMSRGEWDDWLKDFEYGKN